MKHINVIIVEDNEDDLLLMVIALKKAGYAPTYTHVQTRSELEAALQDIQWQLIKIRGQVLKYHFFEHAPNSKKKLIFQDLTMICLRIAFAHTKSRANPRLFHY